MPVAVRRDVDGPRSPPPRSLTDDGGPGRSGPWSGGAAGRASTSRQRRPGGRPAGRGPGTGFVRPRPDRRRRGPGKPHRRSGPASRTPTASPSALGVGVRHRGRAGADGRLQLLGPGACLGALPAQRRLRAGGHGVRFAWAGTAARYAHGPLAEVVAPPARGQPRDRRGRLTTPHSRSAEPCCRACLVKDSGITGLKNGRSGSRLRWITRRARGELSGPDEKKKKKKKKKNRELGPRPQIPLTGTGS